MIMHQLKHWVTGLRGIKGLIMSTCREKSGGKQKKTQCSVIANTKIGSETYTEVLSTRGETGRPYKWASCINRHICRISTLIKRKERENNAKQSLVTKRNKVFSDFFKSEVEVQTKKYTTGNGA